MTYFLVLSFLLVRLFVRSSITLDELKKSCTMYLFLLITYQLPAIDPAQVAPISFLSVSTALYSAHTIYCY
jgi:hypothetical protein